MAKTAAEQLTEVRLLKTKTLTDLDGIAKRGHTKNCGTSRHKGCTCGNQEAKALISVVNEPLFASQLLHDRYSTAAILGDSDGE